MKTFEITYKNAMVMFGDNTFKRTLQGETAEKALNRLAFENNWILTMVNYKEI